MAHIFFNNPADLLTEENKNVLERILARKTNGIPKTLAEKTDTPLELPRILPIDYIIRGIDTQTGQHLDLFPFSTTTQPKNVPHSATLAGHLFYRGEIMNNVKAKVHLSFWGNDTLLAYMTSNVDRKCNFTTFFAHTQGRLYEILIERAGEDPGSRNAVKEAYLYACLEYSQHPSVYDPQQPARYQLQCVQLIKQNPKEITTRTRAFNRRLLKLAHKHIKILRSKHWDKVDTQTQVFIDFLIPTKETEPAVTASKKRRGTRGKKGSAKKKARADAEVDADSDADDEGMCSMKTPGIAPMSATDPAYHDQLPSLHYDTERIHACRKDNPLLQGLTKAMPGMTFGSTVTIQEDEAYEFKDLIDALPGLGKGEDGAAGVDDLEEDDDEKEYAVQLEGLLKLDSDLVLIL